MWDAAMSRTSRASCEMMNDIRPRPSKSHIRRRPACKNEASTYPTNGSHLLLLLRTQYAGRLAGTPRFGSRHSLKKKRRSMSARRDVIGKKRGQRTISGVIRPGYVIRHDSCGRKRIYRTQRARETKVGKWIEGAICKEGQMISVMV